jgi:hypothetical protein
MSLVPPTARVRDLQAVLDDWTHDELVLRRHGQTALADQLARCQQAVRESAEEWLTMLVESEAALYSGKTVRWLQAQFPLWERRQMAAKRGRTRMYRQCALPRRSDASRAFQAGRDAARRAVGA